jgi:putative FmdB family regulatory protein
VAIGYDPDVPIYEYECRACRRRFEALVFGAETVSCPGCRAEDPEKRFSAFAVGGGGGGAAGAESAADAMAFGPSPCGSCGDPRGPGSCALPD